MHAVYGWRGTIGMMTPGTGQQTEFHRKVPDGVAVCTTLLPLKAATVEGLIEMGKHVEEAAALLAQQRADVIVFVCTTGSLIKGIGYDKEIIERIESTTGIPATTTTTAVLSALKALRVQKLSVTTPYIEELNNTEKSFLEKSGFKVTNIKGLGIGDHTIQDVQPGNMYRFSKEQFTSDADAAFISCTGLCVFDIIEALETDLQKPVITSVQASLWGALRRINILEKIDGLGRLFRV
jgi:maleate isomerase